MLEHLMQEHQSKLLTHLYENNVRVEMYASDWIFALYANVIPNTQVHLFLNEFFKHGWAFFYRFTMTFLKVLSSRILATDEIADIIDLIKAPMKGRSF
jgi:hypothetical protein